MSHFCGFDAVFHRTGGKEGDSATHVGFPGVAAGKSPPANAGDTRDAGSIPGSGRCPGGGHGTPLQYPCLENPRNRGAWQAAVPGVAESQARLSTHPSRAGTSPNVT